MVTPPLVVRNTQPGVSRHRGVGYHRHMALDSQSLQVQQVPWGALRPHPANPRNGDVQGIMQSVRLHGVYRPIIVARDFTILAGHHLYAALGELGYDTVPIIQLPHDPNSAEAKKIMLVDNRLSDQAMYDTGVLLDLLNDVDALDGLVGTGYATSDLDDIRALVEESEPLSFGPDVVERLPSMAEKLEKYQQMGRRMIVLDYDQVTYATVTQQLAKVRESEDVDSNAVAVQRLLQQAVQHL